jgi:Anti-sigma-28 factor, FlgM
MDHETNTMRISELKAQIERAAYDVDVDAVAEAFVARMLAVHGALRRADVRALLGDATLSEIQLTA